MLNSGDYRTRTELAQAVGLSPARISRLLNVLKLPTDIQQRLRTDTTLTERRVRGSASQRSPLTRPRTTGFGSESALHAPARQE